jgi:hypothetical protein
MKNEKARQFHQSITSGQMAKTMGDYAPGTDAEHMRGAYKAVGISAKGDPRWATVLLVIGLLLAVRVEFFQRADG